MGFMVFVEYDALLFGT